MTVIAGASLFNGVILLADTRATIQRHGKPDVHCDIAQKLFQIAPSTVVGFSGNVHAASNLLLSAMRQLEHRRRDDPFSLSGWLPRLFRARYAAYANKHGSPSVSFLVGSAVPGRPNIIERSRVVELFKRIGHGRSRIQRNFVPDRASLKAHGPGEDGHRTLKAPL